MLSIICLLLLFVIILLILSAFSGFVYYIGISDSKMSSSCSDRTSDYNICYANRITTILSLILSIFAFCTIAAYLLMKKCSRGDWCKNMDSLLNEHQFAKYVVILTIFLASILQMVSFGLQTYGKEVSDNVITDKEYSIGYLLSFQSVLLFIAILVLLGLHTFNVKVSNC